MRIDLQSYDTWAEAGDTFRARLGIAENLLVQVYTSPSHALGEIAISLAETYPHKKALAHHKFMGPELDAAAVHFSRQEYKIHAMDSAELAAHATWIPTLAKDLLFVATHYDDSLTARREDFAYLTPLSKDKRFFHVRLSHFTHQFENLLTPAPYEINVLSLQEGLCLLVGGERAKIKPWLTPQMNGFKIDASAAELARGSAPQFKDKILAFEKSLPAGIRPYFAADSARLYDRAVVICDGVDGFSMSSRLGAGFDTSSPCRWTDVRVFNHLLNQGLKLADLRGLLVIDPAQINDSLSANLARVYKEIMSEQNETLVF